MRSSGMNKFWIRYDGSGGWHGCEDNPWIEIEASDLEDADMYAYEEACEEWRGYDHEDITEGEPEEDWAELENEAMQSTIDWESTDKRPKKEDIECFI